MPVSEPGGFKGMPKSIENDPLDRADTGALGIGIVALALVATPGVDQEVRLDREYGLAGTEGQAGPAVHATFDDLKSHGY
jgi:hypothetical protein